MPALSHAQILRLHAAALAARLAPKRDTLLLGLEPSVVANLPFNTDSCAQLLSDLATLNTFPQSAIGEAPLAIWLANASALAVERSEAEPFRLALASLPPARLLESAPGHAPLYPEPPQVFEDASRLVRTRLPLLLAAIPRDPLSILQWADVSASFCVGANSLDQWTHVCNWLGKTAPSGFVSVLRIVDQVQALAFSHELSCWAASFIEALCEGSLDGSGGAPDDGGGRDVLKTLKQFVGKEANRWERLRKEVDLIPGRADLSQEACDYLTSMAESWSGICVALNGSRPRAMVSEGAIAHGNERVLS